MNPDIKLKEDVAQLVAQTEKTHRYSMSRIYSLYNQVFKTTEQPQSCASCLIRKVKQLKIWLASQPTENEAKNEVKTNKGMRKQDNN